MYKKFFPHQVRRRDCRGKMVYVNYNESDDEDSDMVAADEAKTPLRNMR